MDDPEILVHASAPTTRKNDEIFYSLADEYLQFESHQTHGTNTASQNHEQEVFARTNFRSSHVNGSAPPATGDANISKDAYGSFPSGIGAAGQSGSFVDDHSFGPTQEETQEETQESFRPVSRLEQLERIQARWRAENASRLSDRRRNSAQIMSSGNWGSAFIDDTQLAYQALESQVFGAESQSWEEASATEEDTSGDEAPLAAEIEVERTPLTASTGNVPVGSSQAKTKSPEPAKSQASKAAEFLEIASTPLGTWSPTQARSLFRLDEAEGDHVPPNFQDLPFEVLPPPPKVTVETPTTLPSQITKSLQTLKQRNAKRFIPSKTLRALAADERGHWFVDCRTWPPNTQFAFWTSLGDDIRKGRLGWGVTLHRETEDLHNLGAVRLYCWGEIVEHVWLEMWLCSHGKIVGSGSRWLDADEEAVIQVA